jgi:hypothetical protein
LPNTYMWIRLKGNFESHRTRQKWKYCRLGLSRFMDSNGNAYYCPRRLAPSWAQLSMYSSTQVKYIDPFQTIVCIWRWKVIWL